MSANHHTAIANGAAANAATFNAPLSQLDTKITSQETDITALENGWLTGSGTWSYSSADAPTFVISINQDVTGILGVGMRIKLTQTTVKYFIVTAVGSYSAGATLVTVYGGTDYTLASATITSPAYSAYKAPFGFPMDVSKWTVTTTVSSGDCAKASPSAATWYGGSGLTATGPTIDIPIGVWFVTYKAVAGLTVTVAAATSLGFRITLSTANNSESTTTFTSTITALIPIITGGSLRQTLMLPKIALTLTTKTTYYLNIYSGASGLTELLISGSSTAPTLIKAECAYL